MKCIQEDRVILKLGSDNKSVYATKCCFKPEETIGGLSFDQIRDLRKEVIWESPYDNIPNINWNLGSWCKDVFSNEVENHSLKVFPQCRCTMGSCDLSQMKFRTVVVNFSHACNLRCKHCFYDKQVNSEIQDVYFNTLINLSKIKCDVALTEEGEPFVDKERVYHALTYFYGTQTKAIFFTTNATLLTTDYIEKLHALAKERGVYYSFVVSCDGITPETYSSIRGVDKFETVIQNIKTIREFGNEDNWINLDGINFVAQPENLHELPKVKDFFEKLSPGLGSKVNIIPFISDKRYPETEELEKKVKNSKEWKEYVKLNKQEV